MNTFVLTMCNITNTVLPENGIIESSSALYLNENNRHIQCYNIFITFMYAFAQTMCSIPNTVLPENGIIETSSSLCLEENNRHRQSFPARLPL